MEIKRLTDEILGNYIGLVNIYHDFHSHPELSFAEHRTAEQIALHLRSEGIECRQIAQTGVLAKIEGTAPGADLHKAVVLRADIDALPIEEQSGSTYASQTKGVMHACGHDMHATVLLGALKVLNAHRDELGCTLFGLFQPGEELNPGGAKGVLAEGPFDDYEVVACIGEHIEPTLPTGKIGICPGKYMAACDELHLTINGKGGHAALRGNIIDPILPTAKLIDALYEIPALSPDQSVPTILSIGRIEANGATNIVPDQVRLEGTMRTFDEQWREQVKKLVNYHCDNIEKKYGVAIERNFGSGYPAVFNSPRLADVAFKVVADAFGPASIATLGVRPTGEDFGYYTERYPSLFYRLGVGYSGEEFEAAKAGSLHTPQLLPDTKAIGIGVSIMTLLALHFAKI